MLEYPLWHDNSTRTDVSHSHHHNYSSPTMAHADDVVVAEVGKEMVFFGKQNKALKRLYPLIIKSNRYQHKWWCRRKRRRLRNLPFSKCKNDFRRHQQLKITGNLTKANINVTAATKQKCRQMQRRILSIRNMYLINKLANDKDKLITNPPSRLKRTFKSVALVDAGVSSSTSGQEITKSIPTCYNWERRRQLSTVDAKNKLELYHTYKLDNKNDKLVTETSPINVSSSIAATIPFCLSTIYSSKIFTPVLLLNVLLRSCKLTSLSTKSSSSTPLTLTLILKFLLLALIITPPPLSVALFVDSSVSIVAANPGLDAASLALTGGNGNGGAESNMPGESSIGNLFMEKPGGSKTGASSSSFNLESKLAAVFRKAAYGTTTKRSIPDSVFVPSLTTVPTPLLTTFR
jgi:hypothetical protein